MSTPNLVLEITAKNEIIRRARGRESVIAKLTDDNKTITWKDASLQAAYHKSVEAFLFEEKIMVETVLLEGQKPDVLPAGAPPPPPMHKMQGELTPKYLEWLMKWKPIAFQNLMGVEVRALGISEKPPADPRALWMRGDVVRTDTRPTPESKGGSYITTKFKMENQIIARRASHLTFLKKEIFRTADEQERGEPFDDPHHPENLHKMAAKGQVEILNIKHAAASAGSGF